MFPERTEWLRRKIGWEDLGKRRGLGNGTVTEYKVHTLCGTKVRVGREGSQLFNFCPRCQVKTNFE